MEVDYFKAIVHKCMGATPQNKTTIKITPFIAGGLDDLLKKFSKDKEELYYDPFLFSVQQETPLVEVMCPPCLPPPCKAEKKVDEITDKSVQEKTASGKDIIGQNNTCGAQVPFVEFDMFPTQQILQYSENILLPNIWDGTTLPLPHRTHVMKKIILHVRSYKPNFIMKEDFKMDIHVSVAMGPRTFHSYHLSILAY